jgi:hypothetical protein
VAAAIIAAVSLFATLVGCSRDPVERRLVGSWQTAVASPAGPYQLRFTTASKGQYQIVAQGPAPVPAETGVFKADRGRWRRDKLDGGSDEGTYEFLSTDSVLLKSKTETLLWNRVANDVAAAATAQAATSGSVAQAGSAAANETAAAASPPSAELLAAGPFGTPLPHVAAAASPQSSTSGSAFGAAAPVTPQPPASGANGPQQIPSTPSPGNAPQQPRNNVQQTARQAKTQAAASASEAANAVKTEADEAAKRTGPFAKAGSKIKNFFTGHKHSSDDDANAAPAP